MPHETSKSTQQQRDHSSKGLLYFKLKSSKKSGAILIIETSNSIKKELAQQSKKVLDIDIHTKEK